MFYDVSQCFTSVSLCFTMFNESCNDRHRRLRLPQGSRQCRRDQQYCCDNFAEICDDAAGIVYIAVKVTPCYIPSWMETGVTHVPGRQIPKGSVICSHQCGFFFLGSNLHLRHTCRANGPSVTVRRIFEFVLFPINLHGVSNECNLNKISCAPCE